MFSRVGGKTKSKNLIISRIPKHKTYVEAFVGGGSVFFSKPKADINVINDKDKDIYDFYKDEQKVGDKMINKTFTPSRSMFLKMLKEKPTDPVKRLFRNIYLSRFSFAGKRTEYQGENWENKNADEGKKWKTGKWKEFLKDVKIHNKDYKKIINMYDAPDTFFFLDPPYSENKLGVWKYGTGVNPNEMVEVLKTIKGKFLMTYDDTKENRKIFSDFKIKGYKVNYELSGQIVKGNKEIMITNY